MQTEVKTPNPLGDEAEKSELLELAKKYQIRCLSAEKGLSSSEALRVIKSYHEVAKRCSCPKSLYAKLA